MRMHGWDGMGQTRPTLLLCGCCCAPGCPALQVALAQAEARHWGAMARTWEGLARDLPVT
jgi:hypothetical protein